MLDRVSDPALREIIDHVTDEEREHVTEMYELILKRDPKQAGRAEIGQRQIETMLHASAPMAEVQTAATAAGLSSPLVSGRGSASLTGAGAGTRTATVIAAGADPNPSPPPIFPDGAWSVGSLKGSR